MNRQPEDRDWDRVVEAIDLDIRPEDLRAAERAMDEARELDPVPVSPAWVDATVARIAQEAAAAREAVVPGPVLKPVLGGGWWQGVKRFAAALLALVGIQSAASAAVVGTAGVVVVVAVALVWKSGQFSYSSMPFRMALEIQLRADQPEKDRSAALSVVVHRVKAVADALLRLRSEPGVDPQLATAAAAALKVMSGIASGRLPTVHSDSIDGLAEALQSLLDPARGVAARTAALSASLEIASIGLSAIRTMPDCTGFIGAQRSQWLQRLVALTGE